MRLALQIIDISICKPLQGARVDVWHANARGDYSTTNTSYLRGWQPSSVYGTVDFDSIFPGRYFERAAHAHVSVRPYNQKRVVHSGQLYFDERIRNIVDGTKEYINSRYAHVKNIDDGLAPGSASDKYDPFVQWAQLGNVIDDGVLAWIAIGVNLADQNIPQPPLNPLSKKRNMIDDHLDH